MKFAVDVPNFGEYADPGTLVELAVEAEDAGWDGFFMWDHVLFDNRERPPIAHPWVALAAVAAATSRIRLGPMVTPVARRRPWVLARETVSLDRLSGGRLTLGVGLGHPPDADFEAFGEEGDGRVRAGKLDEGLEVLAGLWSGRPFSYAGEHFRVSEVVFNPPPVQTPRIPVWVAGVYPIRAPLRRAARWDGVVPIKVGPAGPESLNADEVREIASYVAERRAASAQPFDIAVFGGTPGEDRAAAADVVAPLAEAGATWWLEAFDPWRGTLEEARTRIRAGPPATG